MIKKTILLFLNLFVLSAGVLWFLSEGGYEPVVVIGVGLMTLLTSSGVFSTGLDSVAKGVLNFPTLRTPSDQRTVSEDIVKYGKRFDSLIFYLKIITVYVSALLILLSMFQLALVHAELESLTHDEAVVRLELLHGLVVTKSSDVLFLLYAREFFDSKYAMLFVPLALLVLFVHAVFFDLANRFVLNWYSKKLGRLKNEQEFISECRTINSELMHHRFRHRDMPMILKSSIAQVFSNMYLNNIK